MTKQIFKSGMIVGVVTALALSCLGATFDRVFADVPFDFNVGSATLPAGKYIIEQHSSQYVMVVRNVHTGKSAAIHANWRHRKGAERSAHVIFHQYGDKFFLSQVWTAAGEQGREMVQTRQELELLSAVPERATVRVAAYR